MTRFFDERFEATGRDETNSEGETVGGGSTFNDDADPSTLSGGTPTSWGSKSLKASAASTENCFVGHDFSSSEAVSYFRMELHWEAFPTGMALNNVKDLVVIDDSASADTWRLRIQKSGETPDVFRFSWREWSTGSPVNHVSSAIAIDTTYRFECEYDGTGGNWEWRLDGVIQHQGSITSGPSNIQNNFRYGASINSSSAVVQNVWMDLIAFDDADWVGAEPEIAAIELTQWRIEIVRDLVGF